MTKNENRKKIPKPVMLIILDGWGVSQPYAGNAISQARTPIMDDLISHYPTMTIRASGEAVGLPWGESGNSEVGHLNLGLGRIVYQDLPRINKYISDGDFISNPVLLAAINQAKKNDSALHLMGLCSNGFVHASIDHLFALIALAAANGLEKVFIHAILDGRDVQLNSGEGFIKSIEEYAARQKVGRIATVAGRFYTMDRNNNWDRTALAYEAMVNGKGKTAESATAAIAKSYKEKVFDEEFVPTVICENGQPIGQIKEGDALIFFNYRPDRARQISKAFVMPEMDKFKRGERIKDLYFAAFTEYEKNLPFQVVFPPETYNNSLGEVISKAGYKQLRIAETEKYAHVTYFFNGGNETKSPGEDHELIPSKPVASYDRVPEMSAPEITAKVVEYVADAKYDFILINFANADMVGHTGNMEAAIKAVETLDACVGKIVNSVLAKDGVIMITADHGNVEVMFNMQTGMIDKEHTADPVPFILIGKEYAGRSIGWMNAVSEDMSTAQPQGILSDVAPTVLELMKIEKPEEMGGISLLSPV
jgi:2,3-bisphosphoglycerate-independent phosphoglycerate mutase